MSADFRESVRLERREHTRSTEQRRQLIRGDVVRYAACECSDGLHDAPDHMDYVPDLDSALEDALGMGVRHAHVIRVEKERIDT